MVIHVARKMQIRSPSQGTSCQLRRLVKKHRQDPRWSHVVVDRVMSGALIQRVLGKETAFNVQDVRSAPNAIVSRVSRVVVLL
jgi:hypothetical protein